MLLQWLENFYSHKSVQYLFHNLNIIFIKSFMGFKVICQLVKEPLKGPANVQEIFSKTISLVGVKNVYRVSKKNVDLFIRPFEKRSYYVIPLGVRPSVCKLFRIRVTPTVYVRSS